MESEIKSEMESEIKTCWLASLAGSGVTVREFVYRKGCGSLLRDTVAYIYRYLFYAKQINLVYLPVRECMMTTDEQMVTGNECKETVATCNDELILRLFVTEMESEKEREMVQ